MEEQTVSGNDIPETSDGAGGTAGETAAVPAEEAPGQAVLNELVETSDYTYETDTSPICTLLEGILSVTEEQNELLVHVSENLDAVRETLAAEGEASSEGLQETHDAVETPDGDACRVYITESLGDIELLLAGIKDTQEGISATVSGNSAYLGNIDGTSQELLLSHTEASGNVSLFGTYSVALSVSLLFVCACTAGIHLARGVWGKMR